MEARPERVALGGRLPLLRVRVRFRTGESLGRRAVRARCVERVTLGGRVLPLRVATRFRTAGLL
ncbi:hypothetical protein ACFSTC_48695 [Nonomuraea ferruginea]